MFDIWQEIFSTIRKNKLRTFLTGFSMAWGIFMLILLLGAGNGLKNGASANFGNAAKNTVNIWPGYTSIPYKGLAKGRSIKFDEQEEPFLKRELSNISQFSAIITRGGEGVSISRGKEYVSNPVKGIQPGYAIIENIEVKQDKGRFINEMDMRENRKVIVLHVQMAAVLFRDGQALGKYVEIDKIAYRVIGLYEDENLDWMPDAFIPLTTALNIYQPENGFNELTFMVEDLKTNEANEKFDGEMRADIARKHSFDVADPNAMWIWNQAKNYVETMGIFNGITLFVWIIGVGTLIAGIVGISNIMLITVKERTKEFGIRKALGASPFSILKLILLEALVITGFFGYLGMMAGIGVTELVNRFMPQEEMSVLKNPTVDLDVVIPAIIVLVLAGVLAGYFPAKKAVSIKPIEALRYE